MSVFAGPSISTNGLVFHYDMSNPQKSNIGDTTTNLISNGDFSNGKTGWGSYESTSSSVVTVYDFPTSLNSPKTVLQYNSPSTVGGGGTYGGFFRSAPALTSGTTYTISFTARSLSGNMTFVFSNQNGSGDNNNLAFNSTITSDWRRYTKTASLNLVKNTIYFWNQNISSGTFQVSDIQLEAKSTATTFTSNTRSATQSVLDLTGRTTVTVNSLSYSNNGAFSFNGSSDYISTNLIPNQTQGSVNVWIKMDSLKDYNTIFDNAVGANDWEFWVYATGVARFRTTADNSDIIVDSPALSAGIWYNLTVCWSATFAKLYTNGVLSSTDSVMGTRTTPSTLSIAGGNAGNTKFAGLIPYFQVYNQTLSDAEVLSNFNATRSRFGL
jgi:hypothetical protein